MSKKISDVVAFRNDLFFGGAASISWFETDPKKCAVAATNFVFHGPEYHGVSSEEFGAKADYPIIDTASFTCEILKTFENGNSSNIPISLAIAGYGSGKSHLALTLASLLSQPASKVTQNIINNLSKASETIGFDVQRILGKWGKPFLAIAINGMQNFDLANELSRQALFQIKLAGLDTSPIEELWPRFNHAAQFVERNYSVRKAEFDERFSAIPVKIILSRLSDHDEEAYMKVNEVFEIANGYPIRSIGQESPQQLMKTLCDHYCSETGHFQGVFIVFDEFGRYVEFAADRPHIAGDAALQQLFEGIQDNSDKCLMLCFTQYELKLHLARVASEKQTSIQRYVGRYDTVRKFHLSCNLETLFAHLIEKKEEAFLNASLSITENSKKTGHSHDEVMRWLPGAQQIHVWKDIDAFNKVISVGCWPLHPLATWFLTRLDNLFQSRSALTFVRNAIDWQASRVIKNFTWPIYATDICKEDLIQELIASEEYGRRGTIAQSFSVVEQKYTNDLTPDQRKTLTAVLVSNKMAINAPNRDEGVRSLSALSGITFEATSRAVDELTKQYGVLEWDDRFKRFEILAYAVPRSAFTQLLRKKTQEITPSHVQEIFANNLKAWSDLKDVYPDFASVKGISTGEWYFERQCSSLQDLPQAVASATLELKKAYKVDSARGKIMHCLLSSDHQIDKFKDQVSKLVGQSIKKTGSEATIPLIVMALHDEGGTLTQLLAEYYVVNHKLDQKENEKFRHFIDDHRENLSREIKSVVNELLAQMHYVLPGKLVPQKIKISRMCQYVFEECYPKIVPFRFDGFSSNKGNAPKDCRMLTVEMLKGNLDADWIQAQQSQIQNRAISLLSEGRDSWRILGEDGKLQYYPSNPRLKEIFFELEQALKQKGTLNLGEQFNTMVNTPYGLNIASAGLAIAAFLCPRISSISYSHKGQTISANVLVNDLLPRNFLNTDRLDEYDIYYVPDSQLGEWDELLAKWDMEQCYVQKLLYFYQAQQLQKRVKLPAGLLFEKYKRLVEKAEEADREIKKYDENFEQLVRYFEIGVRKKSAKRALKTAHEMAIKLTAMSESRECWTAEQLGKVEALMNEARQSAILFFDSWLDEQGCMDSRQVAKFSQEMDSVVSYAKTLKLPELVMRTEKHRSQVVSNIEEAENLKFAVVEAESFVRSVNVGPRSPIMRLQEIRDTATKNIQNLERARQRKNLKEIEACLKATEKIKVDAQKQIERHKGAFSELFNATPENFQNVYEIKAEVDRLGEIFLGSDGDLDDLNSMRRQIALLIEDRRIFDDYGMTNSELKNSVVNRIKELVAAEDAENPPLWDTQELYDRFLKASLIQRMSMAEKWMQEHYLTDAQINKLGPEQCVNQRRVIHTTPAYLDDRQLKLINKISEKLNKKLEEHEVEGLLFMFRKLSPKQQSEFLQILQKEVASRR